MAHRACTAPALLECSAEGPIARSWSCGTRKSNAGIGSDAPSHEMRSLLHTCIYITYIDRYGCLHDHLLQEVGKRWYAIWLDKKSILLKLLVYFLKYYINKIFSQNLLTNNLFICVSSFNCIGSLWYARITRQCVEIPSYTYIQYT